MIGKECYIGTEGSVGTVTRQTWKGPFIAGATIIAAFFIYELVKLYYGLTTDVTFHSGYPAEAIFSSIATFAGITLAFLAAALVLSIVIKVAANKNGGKKTVSMLIFLLVILLVAIVIVGMVLAVLQLLVALNIMQLFSDPLEAWVLRFYDGITLVAEWLAIYEAISAVFLLIGLALVSVSTIDYATKLGDCIDLVEHGMTSGEERVKMDGKNVTLKCKERNGIKACELMK